MSVIATAVEPNGITRIFFDFRAPESESGDEARIERTIERASRTLQEDPKPQHQAA